ncbi:nicotinate phosphoribosyltransferase [Flectobacillus roseus]|uniref:Nicotinamide phosphoribosyltransferase n=1 Tax=Flectobacillus roseus TaxID=502259 RepID=A0ABT6YD14_9BACT|nr:nicotinate phosphoribosyltransferase [Flectobacillus roseus]MDI9861482.1 nicotinate phosphoribosyltransferase [Flectobacillus roseus]
MQNNILLLTDSYKLSHYKQYPSGTSHIYSYFESRGGKFEQVTFFGLQYLLKEYLAGEVVTQAKINQAAKLYAAHFGSETLFNREGWEYILEKYQGKLPIRIKAVAEGAVIPTHHVLMTVENTDPKCYWLSNFLETLLVQLWYPCTVATTSKAVRSLILSYLEKTGDPSLIDFKLHDFGFRGVSSVESAGIGGAAHLVNFMGTDTVTALTFIQEYYQPYSMFGFSIPAAEHSTITSWKQEGELEAYRNMLDQYPEGLVAVVSDSYDVYHACEKLWGEALKEKILARNGTLVVRPDSGVPKDVVLKVTEILGEKIGYTINEKGYKVLVPQIRVIQGDGVNYESIGEILENLAVNGWSADNITFGMGGALLQKVHRDTQKFAFKCSCATVDGQDRLVFKDPITDHGKKSKKGRLKLIFKDNEYHTVNLDEQGEDLLVTVFENGEILKDYTFDEVKGNSL